MKLQLKKLKDEYLEKKLFNQSSIFTFFDMIWKKKFNLVVLNLWYSLTSIPVFLLSIFYAGIYSSKITNSLMPIIRELLNRPEFNDKFIDYSMAVIVIDVIVRLFFSFVFFIILGQGPTTSAVTYILICYVKEQHVWFFSDWWNVFKNNYKNSIIILLIDFVVVYVLINAINFYVSLGGMFFMLVIFICSALLIYTIMHLYIYQIMIASKKSIKDIYISACIFTIKKMPQNFLILMTILFLHIVIPCLGLVLGYGSLFWFLFTIAEIFFLPTLTMCMVVYFTTSQIV